MQEDTRVITALKIWLLIGMAQWALLLWIQGGRTEIKEQSAAVLAISMVLYIGMWPLVTVYWIRYTAELYHKGRRR
jgi:hypothetical protein